MRTSEEVSFKASRGWRKGLSMESQAEERAGASLFTKARAGDREAFGQLFEMYHRQLEALAYLSLGPRLRTRIGYEDVIQETFIKAFELHGEIEWQGSRSFFRWLARIAEHVIQNEARRHKEVAHEIPLGTGLSGDGGGPADMTGAVFQPEVSPLRMLRRDERFERLETALNELPADRRVALVCAHIHGLSTKEIARRMGRSPGAVGVLLHRAKEDLKRRFGDTDSLHLPARALAPALLGDPARPGAAERRRGWQTR